jgi:hypothetical protein
MVEVQTAKRKMAARSSISIPIASDNTPTKFTMYAADIRLNGPILTKKINTEYTPLNAKIKENIFELHRVLLMGRRFTNRTK